MVLRALRMPDGGRCGSYRDNWSDLEDLGAVLLGISPQDVDSHEKFATKHNFPFPLLADTDKAVTNSYGVGAPVIGVRRSVFVVDGTGVVRYADRKLIGATFVPRAWEEWTEGALGVWLVVSPWVLAFDTLQLAMMSTVLTGVAVLVLALWVLATDKDYADWRTAH